MCKDRRRSVGSFPRESSFSPIFFALTTTFIIYPSTGKTQNQPHATDRRSFRFTVCVCGYCFWAFLTIQMLFILLVSSKYSAGLEGLWNLQAASASGVYSLLSTAWLLVYLMFCAAVSPPQAAVLQLKYWTSSGGRQTAKRGEMFEVAVPSPGCVLCTCADACAVSRQTSFFIFPELRFFSKQEMSIHLYYFF